MNCLTEKCFCDRITRIEFAEVNFINRFFTDEEIKDNCLIIKGDEVHHIKNVLKLKEKEKVSCIKGSKEYILEIKEFTKDTVLFDVVAENEGNSENEFSLTLFQATPKGDKTEFIIEKATEAGANAVYVINTLRSVAKITNENIKKKQERFSKIAESAACQSGRLIIPDVKCFLKLSEVDFSEFDLLILCYEDEEKTTLKEVLLKNKDKKKIGVFIGPEGGIDESEVSYLTDKGFVCASLGKRILRCETAGLYTLANINYELSE